MPQIDEPTTPAPKSAPGAKKAKPPVPSETPAGIYAFTIDTGSGKIVTVESVDPSGVRHSLSADEKTKLAKTASAMPVRRLVEQAFEAGIEFVLCLVLRSAVSASAAQPWPKCCLTRTPEASCGPEHSPPARSFALLRRALHQGRGAIRPICTSKRRRAEGASFICRGAAVTANLLASRFAVFHFVRATRGLPLRVAGPVPGSPCAGPLIA